MRRSPKQKGKKPGPGARGIPRESFFDCQAINPPRITRKKELPISEAFIKNLF
jgi:hypothetical protein